MKMLILNPFRISYTRFLSRSVQKSVGSTAIQYGVYISVFLPAKTEFHGSPSRLLQWRHQFLRDAGANIVKLYGVHIREAVARLEDADSLLDRILI